MKSKRGTMTTVARRTARRVEAKRASELDVSMNTIKGLSRQLLRIVNKPSVSDSDRMQAQRLIQGITFSTRHYKAGYYSQLGQKVKRDFQVGDYDGTKKTLTYLLKASEAVESRSSEITNWGPVYSQGSQLLLKSETEVKDLIKALRAAQRPVGNADRLSGNQWAEQAATYLHQAIRQSHEVQESVVMAISFLKRAAKG